MVTGESRHVLFHAPGDRRSVGLHHCAAGVRRAVAICTFQVDATPPLGSPLCDAAVPPAKEIVDPLSVRGIVLLGDEQPIVLCAVDWVGIGNGGYDALREALAKAAGTTVDRVAVHTLHQHDAPGCDFEAEAAAGLARLERRDVSTSRSPAQTIDTRPPRCAKALTASARR